jgi:hypothetical protein
MSSVGMETLSYIDIIDQDFNDYVVDAKAREKVDPDLLARIAEIDRKAHEPIPWRPFSTDVSGQVPTGYWK